MCHFHQARTAGFHPRGFGAGRPGFGKFNRFMADWQNAMHQPPVNVRETKDWYEIQLFAPGLNREAFEVSVGDDVLSVRFQPPTADATGDQFLHREWAARAPFERQFALNGKVDVAAIAARYSDGVLYLTLPKLPGSAGQEIPVA